MLLKIPTRTLKEENNYNYELLEIEIQGDHEQIKKMATQLDQIKNVISYFSKSNAIREDLTIKLTLDFLPNGD